MESITNFGFSKYEMETRRLKVKEYILHRDGLLFKGHGNVMLVLDSGEYWTESRVGSEDLTKSETATNTLLTARQKRN